MVTPIELVLFILINAVIAAIGLLLLQMPPGTTFREPLLKIYSFVAFSIIITLIWSGLRRCRQRNR